MTNLLNKLREVSKSQSKYIHDWKPMFFDPRNKEQQQALDELLSVPGIKVHEEMRDQLVELIKSRNPHMVFDKTSMEEAVKEHLKGLEMEEYGVWVYYSWSNRLVHILEEEEFVFVRTNRNQYKITPEERDLLATKKVGLIGLSVGQSVSVTMAMERGFGELRLADFDLLELTNLNRIRTGVHNLGIPKVVAVAREIMEIDPYLNLKLFPEGLTQENMDRFFTEGGDLDLLIDECDGIDVKVSCRFKAKAMKIPVVMEASDRGMVDVERFDLEPDRPILHGMIPDLDPEKLKSLKTNEEKMPYMLKIVGLDTVSTRAKASMLEIGQTISTWPQLASAVTLGGGVTADVVRRIFLNEYHGSGRYYIDVEELIGDKKESGRIELADNIPPSKELKPEWEHLVSQLSEASPVDEENVKAIAEAACHAPSGGNMQPWKWIYKNGNLSLIQDKNLTSLFLDNNFVASNIALGASIENAVLKAAALGLKADVEYFPLEQNKDLIANLKFSNEPVNEQDRLLGGAVFNRHTNRNIEKGEDITEEEIAYLKEIARGNGSELIVLKEGEHKTALAEFIAMAEKLRLMNPMGHKNFLEEMRWTEQEAIQTKDGVDLRTCDFTIVEETGLKLLKHKPVISKLREWKGGDAFKKLSKKSTGSAAALGIITRATTSTLDYIKAGRDLERVWIAANAKGLSFQPQSPLTLLLERLETKELIDDNEARLLEGAKKGLKEIVGQYNDMEPIFIFRLFKGNREVVKSLRRDISHHFAIVK